MIVSGARIARRRVGSGEADRAAAEELRGAGSR